MRSSRSSRGLQPPAEAKHGAETEGENAGAEVPNHANTWKAGPTRIAHPPPPPPWELSPTASLQEPEGVQVALSAVVGYHLPTHRAEGDGQGLALALELWSQARQSSPAGSHPRPARATQEPPRQGSRTPVLGREGHGTADRMSCSICFPPHSPMALPSSKTPWWGGGSSSRLSNLRLVLTSGKWDKVAWPRTPGTLPASLCVRHGGCLCPLMFISRTSLR